MTPVEDSPIIENEPIESANDAVFHDVVETATKFNHRRKFAIALVEDRTGKEAGSDRASTCGCRLFHAEE